VIAAQDSIEDTEVSQHFTVITFAFHHLSGYNWQVISFISGRRGGYKDYVIRNSMYICMQAMGVQGAKQEWIEYCAWRRADYLTLLLTLVVIPRIRYMLECKKLALFDCVQMEQLELVWKGRWIMIPRCSRSYCVFKSSIASRTEEFTRQAALPQTYGWGLSHLKVVHRFCAEHKITCCSAAVPLFCRCSYTNFLARQEVSRFVVTAAS